MLSINESTVNLFAFEISDDDDCLMVSRVECREIERPVVMDGYCEMWSIVEWRGKLSMLVAYTHDAEFWQLITDVRVFEANLSTNPVRLIEIESLDGDCICLSPCSSKSFRSCDYDGVEGDLVYFVDQYSKYEYEGDCFNPSYDTFVYNVRNGTTRPFAVKLSPHNFGAPRGKLDVPLWLLTPK